MFTIPQTQIFYSNNATTMSADTAGAISWVRNLIFLKCLFSHLRIQMGPSITPLTNLNSGFRVYEVDSAVRNFINTWCVKSDWLFLDFWNHGCAHVRGDGHVQFHTNQLSLSDGGVMSTRSRASILRSHLAPRTRMNIIRGRPMAAVSAGGVWTIRSMPHGGIRWPKVSTFLRYEKYVWREIPAMETDSSLVTVRLPVVLEGKRTMAD